MVFFVDNLKVVFRSKNPIFGNHIFVIRSDLKTLKFTYVLNF